MNTFYKITQLFAWYATIILTRPFFKMEVMNRENIKDAKGPAILISNHIRFYDSFLYRVAVGKKSNLSPLRFLGVKNFFNPAMNLLNNLGIISLVYFFMGAITVTTGKGVNKNLEPAKEALKEGVVIAMYPEGRMYYDDTVGPFKWGAAILAEETNTPLIPFAIRKHGRKVIVNVGKPFLLSHEKGPTENTEIMRNVVVELFNEIKFN